METLLMAPVRWMVVGEADYRGFLEDGGIDLNGGFAEAASAQAVFFERGTITQARRLRARLTKSGLAYPTKRDAEIALSEVDAPLYDLTSHGSTWHLRNVSTPRLDAPFRNTRWIMLVEAPRGWRCVRIDGELDGALSLLPWLDGTHSLSSITELILERPEAVRLLKDLIKIEVVTESAARSPRLGELPDFQFLGHSGFFVRDDSDLLVVDPMLVPSTRALAENPMLEPYLAQATAILVTHNHWDHLHYPTLTRLPRHLRLLVPKVRQPSFANPPIATYLRALGFANVVECDPGDVLELGGITLRCVAFHGEPFGLQSRFDGLTYHVRFKGISLYGSVDACFDETSDMEETIDEVASWGSPELFLFGSSGQCHEPPFLAGGLRHLSNELIERPELRRYHPTVDDARRWAERLRPGGLIPYAQFLFRGDRSPHVELRPFLSSRRVNLGSVPSRYDAWANSLTTMSDQLGCPMHMFQPMQGMWV